MYLEPKASYIPTEKPELKISTSVTVTSRSIPEPSFPIPFAGGKISFSENIYFVSSSDRLYDIPSNSKVLNNLVQTLQDFPQVTMFIYGNVQIKNGISGHSPSALKQKVRYNGQWKTANDLMIGRARAVYKYLISKGIDPRRLKYGAGNVYDSSKKDMKKTSFEVRNP